MNYWVQCIRDKLSAMYVFIFYLFVTGLFKDMSNYFTSLYTAHVNQVKSLQCLVTNLKIKIEKHIIIEDNIKIKI